MSLYLQRLLARVAPPASGLAPVSAPANLPVSPLFDADQRIGLPGFSLLDVPSEFDAAPGEGAAGPELVSGQVQPPIEPQRSAPVASPAQPAPGAPLPPVQPEPPNVRLDPASAPKAAVQVEASSPDAARDPRSAPQPAVPMPIPSPAFALGIEPGDFEPAEPISLTEIRVEPAAEARPSQPPVLPGLETLAGPATAAPMTLHQTEAAPLRDSARVVPIAAEGRAASDAVPALPHPAAMAELEPGQGGAEAAPSAPRPVVIEQVVIDIAPPPAPAPAPAEATRDRAAISAAAPMTAEAASVIGPLPQSRAFATLYGMRRR